jgi:hypothetical protein
VRSGKQVGGAPEGEALYFSHAVELLGLLVLGRCAKNIEAVQAVLPFEVCEAIVTSEEMSRRFPSLTSKVVAGPRSGRARATSSTPTGAAWICGS